MLLNLIIRCVVALGCLLTMSAIGLAVAAHILPFIVFSWGNVALLFVCSLILAALQVAISKLTTF